MLLLAYCSNCVTLSIDGFDTIQSSTSMVPLYDVPDPEFKVSVYKDLSVMFWY